MRGTPHARGTQFAQLTAFVAVAEQGNFTRAASHLGLSPAALSQAIRSLEDSFGVRLLNRSTRSVALTDVGEQLLIQLQPALDGVERAVETVGASRGKPAGKLRLAVHPIAAMTLIPPIMTQFTSAYPDIRIEVVVDEDQKDIVGRRFDAGLQFGSNIAQDMVAIPVGEPLQMGTVASPGYLTDNGAVVTPADLESHNCILYRWGEEGDALKWQFAKESEQTLVAVEGSVTVNDFYLALRAALDGVGIVQLPEKWLSTFVASGRLVPVLQDWAPAPQRAFLFHPSKRQVPAKLRVLIDFLRHDYAREATPDRAREASRAA